MILGQDTILKEVKFPLGLDKFQVNAFSIDLRLDKGICLNRGEHFMLKSRDVIELPNNIMAVVFPRSSLNRKMVTLDVTGVVDPGYIGTLVLPVTAHQDITFMDGERIASLVFYRTEMPTIDLRPSKYHKSDGIYIPDKDEEKVMIASGDIKALKAKYKV